MIFSSKVLRAVVESYKLELPDGKRDAKGPNDSADDDSLAAWARIRICRHPRVKV